MGPSLMVSAWGSAWGLSWGNSWGLTRIEESAKSGYWRLYFYQLQEKMLQLDLSKVSSHNAAPRSTLKVRFIKEPSTLIAKKKPLVEKPSKPNITAPASLNTHTSTPELCYMGLAYKVLQDLQIPAKLKSTTSVAEVEANNNRQKTARMLLLLAV